MKAFTELYARLDATTRTNRKVAALAEYFRRATPLDAAWAAFFLTGRKLPQTIPHRDLIRWSCQFAAIPDWLFGECYEAVGDQAETMSLIMPESDELLDVPLGQFVEDRLIPLRAASAATQREALTEIWSSASTWQRFVIHKMITGALRVGVSQRLVVRSLAAALDVPVDLIAQGFTGDWWPSGGFFDQWSNTDPEAVAGRRPYPFLLAHPLLDPPETLGPVENWQLEWKWDGIRAQIIRRNGEIWIWSRGDEPLLERFPEIGAAAARLPDGTVLDGEIAVWRDGVRPFAELQRRLGRKHVSAKIQQRYPAVFLAFDLLEQRGQDLRQRPLATRQARLAALAGEFSGGRLRYDPPLSVVSWHAATRLRGQSRQRGTEGLMIKRRDSLYGVGRPRGDWWKWKVDPYTIDAVLLSAQRGSGRRASLYTDYTFALWDEKQELVPFAKAYSGLTDEEIRRVDRFVRAHSTDRFGPVRHVEPRLVFELAFDRIQRSSRHRSGVAVRFPRILRWREDKQPGDADTLASLLALIPDDPPPPSNQLTLFPLS